MFSSLSFAISRLAPSKSIDHVSTGEQQAITVYGREKKEAKREREREIARSKRSCPCDMK